MNTQELGNILTKMYHEETENKNTMILLFGIMYSSEILYNASFSSLNYTVNEIITYSNIPYSYASEIKKAVDLARFVETKDSCCFNKQ